MMLRSVCLIVAMTAISCGGECDFKASGLCVYTNGLKVIKQDVKDLVQITQEELEEYYFDVPNLREMFKENEVNVTFVDFNMYMDCHRSEDTRPGIYECTDILGVIYTNNDIYVEWRECLAYTALAHELLHNFEHNELNVGMFGGSSPHQPPLFNDNMIEWWESIENQIMYRAYTELESCQPEPQE